MAITYLNEGATSLAAANWSDATGFANSATLVIERGGSVISGGLDQSALGTGINSLHVRAGFTGRIGGPSPLIVDADGGSPNLISYGASAGAMYLKAGGGSALITNLWVGTGGQAYLLGGTFSAIHLSRGYLSADATTIITAISLHGGNSVLEYCTTDTGGKDTGIATLNVYGGSHVIRRPCTTINVYGGTVLYDVPTALDSTTPNTQETTTVNIYSGGTFRHRQSKTTISAVNVWGTYDPSELSIDVTITTLTIYPFGKYALAGKAATVTASTLTRTGIIET